jgi:hypothetical protein
MFSLFLFLFYLYFTTSEERTLCVMERNFYFFLDRQLATHARVLDFFFDDHGTGLSLSFFFFFFFFF